jgi:hypothetical protein
MFFSFSHRFEERGVAYDRAVRVVLCERVGLLGFAASGSCSCACFDDVFDFLPRVVFLESSSILKPLGLG